MALDVWRQLRAFLVKPRRRVAAIMVASLVGGVAEAVLLVVVVRAALVISGQMEKVGTVPLFDVDLDVAAALWTAVGLGLVNLGVHYLNARSSASLLSELVVALRLRITESYLSATWDHQAREREGTIQESAGIFATQAASLANAILSGWSGALHMAALLGAAALVSPGTTAVVLVAGAAIFLALRPLSAWTNRRSRRFVQENSDSLDHLARLASMAMEVRTFGVERVLAAESRARTLRVGTAYRQSQTAIRFGETAFRDIALLFLVGAVVVLYLTDTSNVANIGAVVLLVVRAASNAQYLQFMRQAVAEFQPSLERLAERVTAMSDAAEPTGRRKIERIGTIGFESVSYRYDDVPALRSATFQIEPGEVVGVIGPSGSGKSTLAQVLLRLRRPTSGRVMVDGTPYDDIDVESWTRLVSFVPQEPRLIQATIAENIAFKRPGIDRARVEWAAEAAHIASTIAGLPGGYDEALGARGIGLSGGQKQRVAIARALAGRPELVVLDEPTSALDPESERLIRDTIRELRGSTTFVIIAHRPEILQVCDRVLSVEAGEVVSNDARDAR